MPSSTTGSPGAAPATQPIEDGDLQQWVDLAETLEPAKSVSAMSDSAKFVVSTVSVVGAVLSGFGVVAATHIHGAGQWWVAALALTAAVVALLLSLNYMRLHVDEVNLRNLAEVEAWYRERARNGWQVSAAGFLLLVSVALAAVTAVLVAVDDAQTNDPTYSLLRSPGADTAHVAFSGSVTCSGCAERRQVTVQVGTAANPGMYLDAAVVADVSGNFTLTFPSLTVGVGGKVVLVVDGRTVRTIDAS